MPLQATSGAASQDGFGGNGVPIIPNYIEEVFSTYLYTGTGATQTITNGIDLSGKGGLVWMKGRSGATDHALYDTARGATFDLVSNTTAAQTTQATGLTAFGSTGFSIGALAKLNTSAATYASWTFREQAKFFDVVTYTGTGSNTTIAHALGSVPGCIIVKRTDTTSDWQVYHRSLANTEYMVLNTTAAKATGATRWNSTTPTSTVFSIGTDVTVNASGGTYVAYIFAHDAGGFGLTGTDNVISCGSYTTDGSGNATVNLGYEPQWLLWKRTDAVGNWNTYDTMRGWSLTSVEALFPNLSNAVSALTVTNRSPTSTGFQFQPTGQSNASATFIYIAIRRGPMKVPTSGTSVFSPTARTGNGTSTFVSSGFATDMAMSATRPKTPVVRSFDVIDKLRGNTKYLATDLTGAEGTTSDSLTAFLNTGITVGADSATLGTYNYNTETLITYQFGRAPSYFDEVCYTGTGVAGTVTHNLAAIPELMIVKKRSGADVWGVWNKNRPLAGDILYLQLTNAWDNNAAYFNSTNPTSSVFSVGTSTSTNQSGSTFVAYLFATCAGVSKVGSYTGTAALLTVDCGFTSGARFVLIKRTDSTGDWYVWDSARGISSGNDPYLLLNTTAAEVTGTNYVDTDTTGFKVTAAAPAGLNASGGTYIFLAIA